MNPLDLKSVYVIWNDGWKSDSFLLKMEDHLGGDVHVIGEEHEFEHDYTRQLVGFGGEVWRGMLYRKGQTVIALELIANSDTSPEDVALITCGLALLTFNKFAKKSDVIP